MTIQVFVVTHKPLESNIPKEYKPLFVGHYNKSFLGEGYSYDDAGINISAKNANYCELTGLYYLWKNDSNDVKGIVHYRRFFTKNRFSKDSLHYLNNDDIKKILLKNDVIVGEKAYLKWDIKTHYAQKHYKKDWDNLSRIIEEYYPEYLDYFERLEKSNYVYPCNMFISSKKVFDDYCSWLFDILFKLETITDTSNYSVQQARLYGFISERLLRVWIEKNNLKIFESKIVQTDANLKSKVRFLIEKYLKKSIANPKHSPTKKYDPN